MGPLKALATFGWVWLGALGGSSSAHVQSDAAFRWGAASEPVRSGVLARLHAAPLEERLTKASEGFLGTPYLVSPLGEGRPPDTDPLIRYDAVDCLTFVEETLALSLAGRADEVLPTLNALRYAHEVAYEDRNHLMEAQWLPNNVAKGYLLDITRSVGGPAVQHTQKVLTSAAWRSRSSRALGLAREQQRTGTYPLDMVPLEAALRSAELAPQGTLLLVVRADLPWKATRISHLGFLVRAGKKLYLRHATKGWVNRVVDEELAHFLARITRHNETDPWKVVGVSFFAARDPKAPSAVK